VDCSRINTGQSHSVRVWTLSTNDTVSADVWAIKEEGKAPGIDIEVNLAGQHSGQQYRHSGQQQHPQVIKSGKARRRRRCQLAQTKSQENTMNGTQKPGQRRKFTFTHGAREDPKNEL